MEPMNMADQSQLSIIVVNATGFDNFTEDEFLENVLGPKHLPLKLVLPVTITYVMIFITGVFGNAVTCAVITINPAMQTATNHYLFNLAVSDLMLLVLGLPNELWVFWQQYPWEFGLTVCKGRAFISEMSSYVSVLTIVAFSLERYLAICHPLRLYVMSGLKRHMFVIVAAWIVALVCALPFCWYTELNYVEWPPYSRNISRNSAVCAMLNMPDLPLYEMSCIIFFLGPMVMIMWLYVHIGRAIQGTTLGHRIDGTVHGETRPSQSRKAIVRMLSAVVITFFICWAPFHVQRLLWVYTQPRTFAKINEWLYPLAGSLYYFSTTINPILYNVMSAKYRKAFKQTLRCSPPSNHHFHRDVDVASTRQGTFCRCRSSSSSRIVRVQSVLKNHKTNRNPKDLVLSPLPDDENVDYHKNHKHHENYDRNGMLSLKASTESIDESNPAYNKTLKSSIVIDRINGTTNCRKDEKSGRAFFGETQI
ncbi:neuropeptides capa receptor-like [Venturia canescens]|uniref:neuropeptides capa receptor-like n=1 Tax=Venturia canescens TaxID=32260 RepID=UPI001C9BCF3E|nr:neuropeptides capa receptor-like [Venturia canescens]